MAINKIKLKQIDADFPTLVGQYGSGYFASTGSLYGLSGQAVKYSDLATGNFVYTSGTQNISGSKNFLNRPALSGVGVATLEEAVSINNDNTIYGENTFEGNTIFLNSSNFQNNEIQFNDSTFIFDPGSLSDFSSSFNATFVTFGTTQTITGIKTFTNGIKVGGGGGSGVLHSGQINPVYVSGVTGNSDRYLTFVENTGNGFKNMQMHTGFSYTPSTRTLNSKIFSGNLSGDALRAINSSGVYITGNQSSSALMYPVFVATSGDGYQSLNTDSNFSYNPSTDVLRASTFNGAFSGNALNATVSSLDIGTFTTGANISFNFPAGAPNYIMNSGAFYPSIAGRSLGTTTNRWGNLYLVNAPNVSSDKNLKTEISEIPDSWLDAWQEVGYVRYKFKDAVAQKGLSGARWHVGHIAQDIYEKFNAHNLNAFDIGMLCHDKWDESLDQNGNIVPSGEIWSIRPDECQFMEMALMRRSINRLKSGILI